jgi:hypothetical protein
MERPERRDRHQRAGGAACQVGGVETAGAIGELP